MSTDLADLVQGVLAQVAAGEEMEVYAARGAETEVRAYSGAVESLSAASSAGIGVRILRSSPEGSKVGFAWAGSLEPSVIAATVRDARDNAAFASPDPDVVLASPDGVAPQDVTTFDAALAGISTEEKIAFALELERRVRSADKVRSVRSADYGDAIVEVALATTTGISVASERTSAYAGVSVIAGDGDDTQTGYGSTAGRSFAALDLDRTATEAVERAVRLLGATKPASAKLTVVLDPKVTAQLLGVLSGALNGESVVKGRSFFGGRLGEVVAAPQVRLIDDPTDARAYGAARFDGEGLACRRNVLIDAGVLSSFVYDTVSARRAKTASTGSAVRGGFAGIPGPGCRALLLEPGSLDQAGVLAMVGEGLYVQSITGVHSGVSTTSGDFSVGAEGLMIRNGQLAEPVREVTIASTLQKMLAEVVAIGADVEWLPGVAAGQSLAIGAMSMSGS